MILETVYTPIVLVLLVSALFFISKKEQSWETEEFEIFECGFSSYFFSRFSFSIHYFFIGLIFLFLDLELCFIMPIFTEQAQTSKIDSMIILFLIILLMGLMEEWREGSLNWTL